MKLNIRIFIITTLVVVFTLLFLEVFKYPGFLKKYVFFDPFSIMGIYFVFYSVYINRLLRKDILIIKYISVVLIIFCTVIYLFASCLNAIYYPNYFYYKYHVVPDLLINLIIFPSTILLINTGFISKYIHTFKHKAMMLASIFICIHIVASTSQTLNLVIKDTMFIIFHSQYSYEMKMKEFWGEYYNFIIFVKENTEENATILIPPQEYPWLFEGNGALDRYFLYPRKLLSASRIINVQEVGQVDYIIISKGFASQNIEEYELWPMQPIKSKSYLFVDLTKNTTTTYQGNYNVNDIGENTGWGLINLK